MWWGEREEKKEKKATRERRKKMRQRVMRKGRRKKMRTWHRECSLKKLVHSNVGSMHNKVLAYGAKTNCCYTHKHPINWFNTHIIWTYNFHSHSSFVNLYSLISIWVKFYLCKMDPNQFDWQTYIIVFTKLPHVSFDPKFTKSSSLPPSFFTTTTTKLFYVKHSNPFHHKFSKFSNISFNLTKQSYHGFTWWIGSQFPQFSVQIGLEEIFVEEIWGSSTKRKP